MIIGQTPQLDQLLEQLQDLQAQQTMFKRVNAPAPHLDEQIAAINAKLFKMDDIYKIPANAKDLEHLSQLFSGNFIIGVGLDRSQVIGVAPDRTAFVCVGRLLIDENTSYYFLLDIYIPTEQSSTHLQNKLFEWTDRYGMVDKVAVESFQSMDFYNWCLEKGYETELIHPTDKNQDAIFRRMYEVITMGYFKAPLVPYYTDEDGRLYEGYTNKTDILREELENFTREERGARSWWGAPDKRLKGAIKDDIMYGLAYAIHACQGETVHDIHLRSKAKKMADIFL